MLPSSLTGFAPVVRGVAKSNATVIVRQNGYIIYQSAVPQGAFALKDLNTTNSGGDLDVTIKEEDGSEQHFTQPYASLAILKREDQTDVDISAGELRDQNDFQPTVFRRRCYTVFLRVLPSTGRAGNQRLHLRRAWRGERYGFAGRPFAGRNACPLAV